MAQVAAVRCSCANRAANSHTHLHQPPHRACAQIGKYSTTRRRPGSGAPRPRQNMPATRPMQHPCSWFGTRQCRNAQCSILGPLPIFQIWLVLSSWFLPSSQFLALVTNHRTIRQPQHAPPCALHLPAHEFGERLVAMLTLLSGIRRVAQLFTFNRHVFLQPDNRAINRTSRLFLRYTSRQSPQISGKPVQALQRSQGF